MNSINLKLINLIVFELSSYYEILSQNISAKVKNEINNSIRALSDLKSKIRNNHLSEGEAFEMFMKSRYVDNRGTYWVQSFDEGADVIHVNF